MWKTESKENKYMNKETKTMDGQTARSVVEQMFCDHQKVRSRYNIKIRKPLFTYILYICVFCGLTDRPTDKRYI